MVRSRSKLKAKPHKKVAPRKKAAPVRAVRSQARAEPRARDKVLDNVLTEVTAQPETRHVEQWVSVPCPYCGEEFEVHVTSESDGQTMYEDCHVCCRPIALHVHSEEGELQIEAHRS